MIVRGRHFLLGECYDFDCADDVIRAIDRPDERMPDIGNGDSWVIPGLIDLQINGYAGIDFCSASLTAEGVERVSHALAEAGVTAYLATVITNSTEAITASLRAIRQACAAGGAAGERVLGIHLEGPYISPEDGPRGTHPRPHVRPPDWEEFCRWQDASGGRVRLVTVAPEIPGAVDFIARAVASGVVVGLGHHAAGRDEINAAVAAGARLCTHLGNGAHSVLPRHPNYLWEQLANDALQASLIVDGHHLPPTVVKSFYRVKGADRIILVSDVVWLAGLLPQRYQFAGQEVELRTDGSVHLAGTQYLAGSALKLCDSLNNMMAFAGAPFADAVRMATANPARLIGAAGRGRLEPGARADLLLLRPERGTGALRLAATIVGGQVMYQPSGSSEIEPGQARAHEALQDER